MQNISTFSAALFIVRWWLQGHIIVLLWQPQKSIELDTANAEGESNDNLQLRIFKELSTNLWMRVLFKTVTDKVKNVERLRHGSGQEETNHWRLLEIGKHHPGARGKASNTKKKKVAWDLELGC